MNVSVIPAFMPADHCTRVAAGSHFREAAAIQTLRH